MIESQFNVRNSHVTFKTPFDAGTWSRDLGKWIWQWETITWLSEIQKRDGILIQSQN